MNKKRKIILKIWIIFISILILIMLFLLGLKLPKLLKSKQQQDNNKVETQFPYQNQYIHDTNKFENIIGLMNSLKRLKELKKQQKEIKQQQKQTEYQYKTEFDDENKLVKDIAVVNPFSRLAQL
ncbi:conserved hypothetical protein (plasmid) [Aster yellows witches'-broom phytoplasma AYWB]|uniref:Uncharacterized protein n=2 Tax=Aster yellows witches'-broom phytoplasma TaxID=229545 RepID=Q2NIE0_AYWBP|nr:conserved hypothetical protein [Aster yellows witches'-broom phytoplasma AYWB]